MLSIMITLYLEMVITITWDNVIDYNWFQLPITITQTLVIMDCEEFTIFFTSWNQ